MSNKSSGIVSGLFWKLFERFGVHGVQFVLQVILARILDPEHYGVLSLMMIFTTLADVFIQKGFNTALIQNKDVTEEDYSSVFWVTFGVASALYVLFFFSAPLIATFYNMPDIVVPFRVLTLMLLPGAFNSVQLAKVSRQMDFRKVFFSNIGGIVFSGLVGIAIAYMGGGLWALVVQTLLNTVTVCVVMRATVELKISFVCNFSRVKVLFSYGWKLLLSSLLDNLYQDLRSLVVGKKYDSGTLGYYNRGKQFPQFFINSVNGAVQSVMLPAMSAKQDDRSSVKAMMRNSIMLGSYIIFPLMAGLAVVATPLIRLLLTEKWLPCVPYMQIYCFSLAFMPVHTSNLQAINAMGRSDIFLKLELIKKAIGITALAVAVIFFDSPIAIALTGVFTTFTSCFINAYPNKKLLGYSYVEQMRDILPSFVAAVLMGAGALTVQLLNMSDLVTLVLQIVVGVVLYVLLSLAMRIEAFRILYGTLRKARRKQ